LNLYSEQTLYFEESWYCIAKNVSLGASACTRSWITQFRDKVPEDNSQENTISYSDNGHSSW